MSDVAFALNRRFEAPPALVWKAWSEPERLAEWWGPKGCRVRVESFDFRLGGFFHYAMLFPGQTESWGRFLYREIEAPGRLVWLNSFATAKGGIARAPFSDKIPMEIENSVSIEAEGVGTRLELRARPFGAEAEEEAYFREIFPSLGEGFGGTFDKLADHLGKG